MENQTPLEDLRKQALEHYKEASSAIHHWSSFVENAIKSYNPIPPKDNNVAMTETDTGKLIPMPDLQIEGRGEVVAVKSMTENALLHKRDG